jgi:hypothetical protein
MTGSEKLSCVLQSPHRGWPDWAWFKCLAHSSSVPALQSQEALSTQTAGVSKMSLAVQTSHRDALGALLGRIGKLSSRLTNVSFHGDESRAAP